MHTNRKTRVKAPRRSASELVPLAERHHEPENIEGRLIFLLSDDDYAHGRVVSNRKCYLDGQRQHVASRQPSLIGDALEREARDALHRAIRAQSAERAIEDLMRYENPPPAPEAENPEHEADAEAPAKQERVRQASNSNKPSYKLKPKTSHLVWQSPRDAA
jgi:hypothetical protein